MPFSNLAYASERREDRDDVHHRTNASAPRGSNFPVVIVNISPNGLMARCDLAIEAGTRLSFALPDLSPVAADVRWSLGGRIGCEFEQSIGPAVYYSLLSRLMR